MNEIQQLLQNRPKSETLKLTRIKQQETWKVIQNKFKMKLTDLRDDLKF